MLFSYQEGKAASGLEEAGGHGKDYFKLLDRTQGHNVEASAGAWVWFSLPFPAGVLRSFLKTGGEIFGASGKNIDVSYGQGTDNLAQESRFFSVRFDERDVELGRPKFYGEAGEASAGTNIGDSGDDCGIRKEMTGGEKRFAEMTGDDFN